MSVYASDTVMRAWCKSLDKVWPLFRLREIVIRLLVAIYTLAGRKHFEVVYLTAARYACCGDIHGVLSDKLAN